MFYPRRILPLLEKELTTSEILVLTGMRQVGKTTLLKHLFSRVDSTNKIMFDLENPLHRKVFEEENFDAIWNNLQSFAITNTRQAFLFLDEVQHLPQISQVAKYLYDHWQVKFFLTGSSSFYLRNLFPESMAGRKVTFELFPLTFSEFLLFKQVPKQTATDFTQMSTIKNRIAYEMYSPYYKEYIEFGGFPKVVREENHERKRVLLEEIFTSYFEKDVKTLADFKNLSKLRDLLLLLAPRIGSRLEIGKLASELGVSRETIYNYLSFLEQTYFICLIPRYASSIDRQAAGNKKLYLCDTGLANILGKLSLGQQFEQSVFENLRPFHRLQYFSKEGRGEIDFIVDERTALEVKLTSTRRDVDHLKRRSTGLGINEWYIASFSYCEDKEVLSAIDL